MWNEGTHLQESQGGKANPHMRSHEFAMPV